MFDVVGRWNLGGERKLSSAQETLLGSAIAIGRRIESR